MAKDAPGAPLPEATSFFTWEGPAIALLDLDAFFASVEQRDHPEWRGKPVIVGGSPERRGVVTTASYEARPYGVHSAMPSAEAVRKCPHAIWTSGHFDRYRQMSRQVMDIILAETPLVEQVSIDEAFFDITPGRFQKEHPVAICQRIQRRVSELGITCSIGLATSKTVAKIASDCDKPRGLTVVAPGTERAFLDPLPVRDMSGIGKATSQKLNALGIYRLGQLAAADADEMKRIFGVAGPLLVKRAQGAEGSPVRAPDQKEPAKSVSNERTFVSDLTTRDDIEAAILSIAAKVGARLRKKGLTGREVTLKLKYGYSQGKSAQRQMAQATDDEGVFGPAALKLLDEIWQPGMPVRLVGVGVSRFYDEPQAQQLSLFELEDDAVSAEEMAKSRQLRATTDSIKERFGEGLLVMGRDMRLKARESDTVPMHKDEE